MARLFGYHDFCGLVKDFAESQSKQLEKMKHENLHLESDRIIRHASDGSLTSDIVIRTRRSEWRVVVLADDRHESYRVKRKNADFLATSCMSMWRSPNMELLPDNVGDPCNGERKVTLGDNLQIYIPCTHYQRVE